MGCYCDAIFADGSCPSPHLHCSSFTGFDKAITSCKLSNNKPFSVNQTVFDQNVTGIYSSAVDNIIVTENHFTYVGDNATPMAGWTFFPVQTGLQINTGSGYRVEENHFDGYVGGSVATMGAFLYNTGQAQNQVYHNYFQNFVYANLAQGQNRNVTDVYTGLQYLCNQHSTDVYDLLVVEDDPSTSVDGVRHFQGEPPVVGTTGPTISAGNIFTHSSVNDEGDLLNHTTWPIDYYYNASAFNEIPINYTPPPYVQPYPATNINTCPVNSGSLSGTLTAATKSELTDKYNLAESAFLNLLYSYNQLMDGGDQNSLLSTIENSWSQNAWSLRNELMLKSPFLSSSVIKEAAMSNVMPEAMLLEVCLANPEGTQDTKLLYALQNDIPRPLPQYMIDQIIASWDVTTSRTAMEGSLAHYSHEMAVASDFLLTDLYFDETDADHNAEIRYWLDRIQVLPAKFALADNYFNGDDYTSANDLLNSIPSQFNLSEQDLAELDRYQSYLNFRNDIKNDGRSLLQLKQTEIASLRSFAEGANDLPGIMAQNLLCFVYHACYSHEPNLSFGNYRKASAYHKASSQNVNRMDVTPNPSTTYASFSYEFPLLRDKAVLKITDGLGRDIQQFDIRNKQGQIIWDLREVQKGIYFYQIRGDASINVAGKVVVDK